jgi:hypothetical protein
MHSPDRPLIEQTYPTLLRTPDRYGFPNEHLPGSASDYITEVVHPGDAWGHHWRRDVYFGPSLAGVLRAPAPLLSSENLLTALTRHYSSVRSMTAYELLRSFHLCSHAQDSSNRLDGVKFYRPPLSMGWRSSEKLLSSALCVISSSHEGRANGSSEIQRQD